MCYFALRQNNKKYHFKILHSFSRGTGQSINKILNNIVKGEIWHHNECSSEKDLTFIQPDLTRCGESNDEVIKLWKKYFHLTFNSTKFLPWKCFKCQNAWIKQKFMETNTCVMLKGKFLLLFILFIWSRPGCPGCSWPLIDGIPPDNVLIWPRVTASPQPPDRVWETPQMTAY